MLQLKERNLPDIPYSAVARQPVDLQRDTQTHRITLSIMTDLDIAAGTTNGAVVAENPVTLVRWVRILENGAPVVEWDARALAQMTEHEAAKPLSGVPLVSGAVQAGLHLRQQLSINLAHPLAANPQETAFVPLDRSKPLQLEIEWATDRKAALVSAANDRVFTFTNTLVRAVQYHDPFATQRPIFLPRVRRIESGAIVGAMTDLGIPINSNHRLRALLLHGLSDDVTADAIMSLVTFEGDSHKYVERVRFAELHEAAQADFGGATDMPGYLLLNFQKNGRLGQVFNPFQDTNPRLTLDVAQIGATATRVRVYVLELVAVPGFTRDVQGAF